MFERCLICTDFTDSLQRLVHFVPSLAAGGFTHITFFHSVPYHEDGIVREDTEAIAAARSRLAPALENVPDGVTVEIDVPSGRPLDTIPRAVDKRDCDLIIVGTPSRSLLEERVFGSTSLGLARATSVPLLIFRPQLLTTYTEEELALRCQHLVRYLLVPYNDGKSARYAIEQIKTYVGDRDKSSTQCCLLCWVVDDGSRIPVEPRMQDAEAKLKPVKSDLETTGLTVNVEVMKGTPLTRILDSALSHDVTAIAVGNEDRNTFIDWTVPSLAQELLRVSWFPVLVFQKGKGDR